MPVLSPPTEPDEAPATGRAHRIDVRGALSAFVHGRHDPTTRLGTSAFLRATLTPDGPATVLVRWGDAASGHGALDAEAWGPGRDWLLGRVESMTGADDPGAPELVDAPDAVVAEQARRRPGLRIGASGTLYHELLPTIIEQRITSVEAKGQWRRLCRELSDPAPGPALVVADLLLPPAPDRLHRRPSWWFHPLGIERKRAEPLTRIARHAGKLWSWSELGPVECGRLLELLPGIGPWTVGSVLGPALGDPDAVAVGDYHLKNMIGWALAGEARASDERMLELLAPYAGQRGRVVRLVKSAGYGAPRFGPRQRILPMARW